MDHVTQCPGLYVGSLEALDRPDLLESAGITHILSVLEFGYCSDWEEFSIFQRLLIQAEDDPSQNLIRHFTTTNAFIDQALPARHGAVLIHCAMGQSRSATIACAYLMYRQSLEPKQALEIVQGARAEAEPNEGFMRQLGVYHDMLRAASVHVEQAGGGSEAHD